jgi:hypothetical protein
MPRRDSPSRHAAGDSFRERWDDRFCRAVGTPTFVTIEHSPHPERIDHVWVTMEVAGAGNMRAAINTKSLRNEAGGFDPRIRLGVLHKTDVTVPASGLFPSRPFDYAEIERQENIFYEHMERRDVELLITEKIDTATLIEVWGDVYARGHHRGIHQIHCRRASCAVPEDLRGRDGALRCYFEGTVRSELLLFKFCGQP